MCRRAETCSGGPRGPPVGGLLGADLLPEEEEFLRVRAVQIKTALPREVENSRPWTPGEKAS